MVIRIETLLGEKLDQLFRPSAALNKYEALAALFDDGFDLTRGMDK